MISEHARTYTDAVLEYKKDGSPIENMPLAYYFGNAVCLDVSHKRYPDYIEIEDFGAALKASGLDIRKGALCSCTQAFITANILALATKTSTRVSAMPQRKNGRSGRGQH